MMTISIRSLAGLILICLVSLTHLTWPSGADINGNQPPRQVKNAGFVDPNTGYLYRVTSSYTNVTTTTNINQQVYALRSAIKVSRHLVDEATGQPLSQPEAIQTLGFSSPLVDFDLDCSPTHCYLVVVVSRNKKNVELYAWERTQFDLLAKKDSFSQPQAVKIFRIHNSFYIAVAQDQLHLSPVRWSSWQDDDDDQTRFIGCSILKFDRHNEHNLRYHQFIKLPFNPLFVNYYSVVNQNVIGARPTENHYLVFSISQNWDQPGAPQALSFRWSPLNEYFWPQKLPPGVTVSINPNSIQQTLRFPSEDFQRPVNFSGTQQFQSYPEPVESCFSQLQRLLSDREAQARKLLDLSQSLWRSPKYDGLNSRFTTGPTNITSQVIVHGNVIVKGSVISSPQITLFGRPHQSQLPVSSGLLDMVNSHSPSIVENRLKQAHFKLNHIRDKLAFAVPGTIDPNLSYTFKSRIRFFGSIQANQVIFNGGGIINHDVRLNGIPFRKLERERIFLEGPQEIGGNVIFNGNVMADLLEIHGRINQAFFLRDAVDITSQGVQRIEPLNSSTYHLGGLRPLEFHQVSTANLTLGSNVTINSIWLNDFITKDPRTQPIHGRKSFRRLVAYALDLAHPAVLLNNYNLHDLEQHSIKLMDPSGQSQQQVVNGSHFTFSRPVSAERLFLSGPVNGHINFDALVRDSVKVDSREIQIVSGLKNFHHGLKIAHLTTEGMLNQILVRDMFSLNSIPPIPDYRNYPNSTIYQSVTGQFTIRGPSTIHGNLMTKTVNQINLLERAVRRYPGSLILSNVTPPHQIVSGRKIFRKPLRVINNIRLYDGPLNMASSSELRPSVNGFNMRDLNEDIRRRMENPGSIFIDNLEIDGNLDLPILSGPQGQASAKFGNFSICPIDVLRNKVVHKGFGDQLIDSPVQLDSLRARFIQVEPGALNGFSFPNDFVLRSSQFNPARTVPGSTHVEIITGQKHFQNLWVSPQSHLPLYIQRYSEFPYSPSYPSSGPGDAQIILGTLARINNIPYPQLQAFVDQEKSRNLTGETVFQTLSVHGNLIARRINGNRWPDDILLKSVVTNPGITPTSHIQRRIYSPLTFIETSQINVENQLVLRGPIRLTGNLNGVNLTEFARQSVTYGDKELFSVGRPLKNKIFSGGIVVTGEMRTTGLIEGIDIDKTLDRVVTIRPIPGRRSLITSSKVFMSDVFFLGPVSFLFVNGLPIDYYLRRIDADPANDNLFKVHSKKMISGALRVNKNLIVSGRINGVDYTDLHARAISLNDDNVQINKTLTVEGDVYMDNLLIDEKNGTVDGVRLTNLLHIDPINKNELEIIDPSVTRHEVFDRPNVMVFGSLNDCQISCSLVPLHNYQTPQPVMMNNYSRNIYNPQPPMNKLSYLLPIPPPAQQSIHYPARPIYYQGRNMSLMRSTPPYTFTTLPSPTGYAAQILPQASPLIMPEQMRQSYGDRMISQPANQKAIHNLALRKPVAIQFDPQTWTVNHAQHSRSHPSIQNQMQNLRDQFVSLNLLRLSDSSNIVVGFIDALSNDVARLHIVENPMRLTNHFLDIQSFILMDHIDFLFRPTTYHLAAGYSSGYTSGGGAGVYISVGGSLARQFHPLPVKNPNAAWFLEVADHKALFLLISQDYTIRSDQDNLCPRSGNQVYRRSLVDQVETYERPTMGDVHVYIFHSLQNSSSLESAYFDLYQSIDLPGISDITSFTYKNSTYALAVSQASSRVYVLLLRGYSGFQIVSYLDVPLIDHIRLALSPDEKPALIIYLKDGQHKVMESVVI